EEDDPADLSPRNPIITVMGHVDHGKTTLLDHLRKTNVTSQEAGGITQHIGAYEVRLKDGKSVTFLDTPGHEAFTAMRARGAKVTDVVIIVIAADDAVMPQTREAINHAQAAEVPMIFAINKIDKPNANPDQIKSQLAEMNILLEDWGGTFQSQEISALKGQGVDDLLEKVILEAELLELKANSDRNAAGTVIEARLDRGLGNVATMLVQNGTLEVGDEMVIGVHYAKVRALINQNGKRIRKAGPSKPVQVLGLSGQPQAGDTFHVFKEDGKAKNISQRRGELYREQQLRQTRRITLEEIGRRRAIGNFKELNVIIRGDVDGSVEALSGALLKLSTEEVQVNILLKAVGAITEGDVLLASASDAIIIAFNVRPASKAKSLAEKEEIDIRTYSVIYDAINDVTDALEGLLSPEIREEIMGTAEVREVFKITKVGAVAGCMALSGKIYRDEPLRVIRDGVVIYDSTLSSLKRFKDDVKEVNTGMEFGAQVTNYNDIRKGDVLESYKRNEIKRKLKPQR
ncbi:MAG: translation initiation factor IF-2, partial [Bacteroidota bacterium]